MSLYELKTGFAVNPSKVSSDLKYNFFHGIAKRRNQLDFVKSTF